jgi:hypothetical protein
MPSSSIFAKNLDFLQFFNSARNNIFITKKMAIIIFLSDNDRHFFGQLTVKMKQPCPIILGRVNAIDPYIDEQWDCLNRSGGCYKTRRSYAVHNPRSGRGANGVRV